MLPKPWWVFWEFSVINNQVIPRRECPGIVKLGWWNYKDNGLIQSRKSYIIILHWIHKIRIKNLHMIIQIIIWIHKKCLKGRVWKPNELLQLEMVVLIKIRALKYFLEKEMISSFKFVFFVFCSGISEVFQPPFFPSSCHTVGNGTQLFFQHILNLYR